MDEYFSFIKILILVFFSAERTSFSQKEHMNDQVDILLATYNGSKYIQEQIESILSQTYPSIHLWIRDDGSKDTTVEILTYFAKKYPSRITFLPTEQNLGIKGNFSRLMECSKASYMMFSDQDDHWLPNKVELSLKLIKQMEVQYGWDTPLLVHTDLTVVRSDLTEINSSFWKYTHLNPSYVQLNRLLTQNVLTGCTMLFNRKLLELALPIPSESFMHDWWIALVASAFGQIKHLPLSTILYRQHTSNGLGAKPYGLWHFIKRSLWRQPPSTHCSYQQARLFLERYQSLLDPKSKNLVSTYASLQKASYLTQKKNLIKFRFLKQGFLRNFHHLLLPH